MKKIAIVILNWNGAGLLKKFLPVLIKHTKEERTAHSLAK